MVRRQQRLSLIKSPVFLKWSHSFHLRSLSCFTFKRFLLCSRIVLAMLIYDINLAGGLSLTGLQLSPQWSFIWTGSRGVVRILKHRGISPAQKSFHWLIAPFSNYLMNGSKMWDAVWDTVLDQKVLVRWGRLIPNLRLEMTHMLQQQQEITRPPLPPLDLPAHHFLHLPFSYIHSLDFPRQLLYHQISKWQANRLQAIYCYRIFVKKLLDSGWISVEYPT